MCVATHLADPVMYICPALALPRMLLGRIRIFSVSPSRLVTKFLEIKLAGLVLSFSSVYETHLPNIIEKYYYLKHTLMKDLFP